MLISDSTLAVWALIVAIPAVLWSRAWLLMLKAALGSLEEVDAWYTHFGLRPRDKQLPPFATFIGGGPDPAARRRYVGSLLLVLVAAIGGAPIAFYLGPILDLGQTSLRAIQVGLFGGTLVLALVQMRASPESRWLPRTVALIEVVIGGVGVLLALLPGT